MTKNILVRFFTSQCIFFGHLPSALTEQNSTKACHMFRITDFARSLSSVYCTLTLLIWGQRKWLFLSAVVNAHITVSCQYHLWEICDNVIVSRIKEIFINFLCVDGDGHRTKWTVVRNQSLASESVYYDSELLPTFGGTFAAKTEVVSVSMESGDSMRPLRRTACSCPNCRDGANRFVLLRLEIIWNQI